MLRREDHREEIGTERSCEKIVQNIKGIRIKKEYHKLRDCYSGISEGNIHKVLSKSTIRQKLNARFEKRARLRPIRARDVQIRH